MDKDRSYCFLTKFAARFTTAIAPFAIANSGDPYRFFTCSVAYGTSTLGSSPTKEANFLHLFTVGVCSSLLWLVDRMLAVSAFSFLLAAFAFVLQWHGELLGMAESRSIASSSLSSDCADALGQSHMLS